MISFVSLFLFFVLLYHILVSFFSFGQEIVSPYVLLAIRDIGWLLAFGVVLFAGIRKGRDSQSLVSKYWNRRGEAIMLFLLLIIIGFFVSILLGVPSEQIVVGVKYTLYYFVPFLTAIYIGMFWKQREFEKSAISHSDTTSHSEKNIISHFPKWIRGAWIVLVVVLVVGRLWQVAKNIRPDRFMQFGYGPLGDYVFGEKPPLYYLTGPQGFQRLSGIFSGPNNYGYFLVAFFGLFRYGTRKYASTKRSKTLLRILFIGTLLATFSRGAILGVLIQVILISYVVYHAQRKIIVGAIILGLVAVGGLSLLKRQSTVAHLQAKFSSLTYVSHKPWGFGLGSSGPSSLSQGGYLPENFFVQIMMDVGIIGFILWSIIWLWILRDVRKIYLQQKENRTLLFFCTVGFVGLMVEGLFLHVLEDSMVNYLYFVVWGVCVGYIYLSGLSNNKRLSNDKEVSNHIRDSHKS